MTIAMTDGLYDAVDWFVRFMDRESGGHAIVFLLLALLLPPLATVAHEAGHALAARRFGVPIRAFVVEPEGPAVTLPAKDRYVRVGLGLGRDLRSRAPRGWVLLELSTLSPEEAIAVLRAGPVAEGAFAALLLVVALVPQSLATRIILALNGLAIAVNARANLRDRSHPMSDGYQIHRVRTQARLMPPTTNPAASDDPHATTSVAPPGY